MKEVTIMKNSMIGLILMSVGVLMLLGNLGVLGGEFMLLAIGAAFLIFYGLSGREPESRKVGLLIPGLIIIAVGLFAQFESRLDNAPYMFFVFLGLAFLGVYLIHTRNIEGGKWPLFPALGLFGFAAFVFTATTFNLEFLGTIMNNLVPAGAIVGGLVLLVKARKKA
jgi:hypothetical protein